MAFVAVDKDGTEWIYPIEPNRFYDESLGEWDRTNDINIPIKLPYGTIAKLIGRELAWQDEPVAITENP